MTPQEKAKDMTTYYRQHYWDEVDGYVYAPTETKRLVNSIVDLIIDCVPSVNARPPNYQSIDKGTKEYWQQVKTELE